MVLSAATKIRCALCLIPGISHTTPILGKLKYSMDSSRQHLWIALIDTAEIQLLVITGGKTMTADSHRRRKRQKNMLVISFFILFFVCTTSYDQ